MALAVVSSDCFACSDACLCCPGALSAALCCSLSCTGVAAEFVIENEKLQVVLSTTLTMLHPYSVV